MPAALWGWRLDQQRDVICFNGLCKRLLDGDRTVHERLNGEVCVVSFPLRKLHEGAGGCYEQLEATHGYCRLEADVNNRWWVAEAGTSACFLLLP